MASRRLGDTYGGYRERLVELLREAGIHDLAVLRAFGETPRHLFVPEASLHRAYDDSALPIGAGQSISQPTTQALFLQSLQLAGRERALEVGTGSGYQAALLSHLVESVVTVERVPELAQRAREAIEAAQVSGVTVVVGDGSLGWRPHAPFDVILVAAASPTIPEPLISQLSETGRLIIPIEKDGEQELTLVQKQADEITRHPLGDAKFVPLIGKHGFSRPQE